MTDNPYDEIESDADKLRYLANRYLKKQECIDMLNEVADKLDDSYVIPTEDFQAMTMCAMISLDHGLGVPGYYDDYNQWFAGYDGNIPSSVVTDISQAESARNTVDKVIGDFVNFPSSRKDFYQQRWDQLFNRGD